MDTNRVIKMAVNNLWDDPKKWLRSQRFMVASNFGHNSTVHAGFGAREALDTYLPTKKNSS